MKTYRVVLWALALTGLCADQASKYVMFSWLNPAEYHSPCWLFKADENHGFALSPNPTLNQGALFGLGREHPELANPTFAFVSLLAAVGIICWSSRRSAANDLWVCMALGLILAGTLGNLYDRVVFGGVRDFLHWNYLFDWPVFNVADSCLVCGACLLLVQAFGRPSSVKADKPADAPNVAVPKQAPVSCVSVTQTTKG